MYNSKAKVTSILLYRVIFTSEDMFVYRGQLPCIIHTIALSSLVSMLTVAHSLVSILLVALSSLVSTLVASSRLSELTVSACREVIGMLW